MLEQLRVLYVEDEESVRESMNQFLRRRVGALFVAENGEKGLELFYAFKPDIIISDIKMPRMSGLDMLETVRTTSSTIPVIITSAFNDEQSLLRAIELGVDKFLKKPIDTDRLLEAIQKAAMVVMQQREIEEKNHLINLILNYTTTFTMIVRYREVVYVNKPLLSFAGVENVESFNTLRSMEMLIVPKEDSFYKNYPFEEWINIVATDQEQEFVVYLRSIGDTDEDGAYVVRAEPVSGSKELLVTFTDVTKLDREKEAAKLESVSDHLTGIFNRRKFDEELKLEMSRNARYKHTLTLISFDIDHFKLVNDCFGHQNGDLVLQTIAQIVKQGVRRSDLFARVGGEEFAVLLPETDAANGALIAEKLRKAIAAHDFGEIGQVTCSFGVAQNIAGENAASFTKRADDLLYRAKNHGRNRVESVL